MACLHQRLRDQQIGCGVRLPRRGVMLANPALAKSELIGPAQGLQVPSMTIEEATLRRMRGHREQAVLHRAPPGCWFDENSLSGRSRQQRLWHARQIRALAAV